MWKTYLDINYFSISSVGPLSSDRHVDWSNQLQLKINIMVHIILLDSNQFQIFL